MGLFDLSESSLGTPNCLWARAEVPPCRSYLPEVSELSEILQPSFSATLGLVQLIEHVWWYPVLDRIKGHQRDYSLAKMTDMGNKEYCEKWNAYLSLHWQHQPKRSNP